MIIDDPQFPAFVWDEAKRLANIRKHGIDFVRAARLLSTGHLVFPSPRFGEERQRAVCKDGEELITIVYVTRDQTCRIISARRAHRSERRQYQAIYDRRDRTDDRTR